MVGLLALLGLSVVATPDAKAATTCPTSGHNVTISAPCGFDAGAYSFTGTLTLATTVTAQSNIGSARVELSADHIVVAASGVLHANELGFAAASGPGYSAVSLGAGHGGLGGNRSGSAYGDVAAPITLGSGATGAPGGGAIHLRVPPAGGTITIDGLVSANGRSNTGACASDGGAGGSIWIQADLLGGVGSITARGGTSCNARRAGGGGRIALEYRDLAAGATVQTKVSAAGGATVAAGGAGTVRHLVGATRTLVVDNGGVSGAPTPQLAVSETWERLVVRAGGYLQVASGKTLRIESSGDITGGVGTSTLEIASSARLEAPDALSIDGVNVTLSGDLSTPGLTCRNHTFTLGGALSPNFTTLTVDANATFVKQGVSPLALDTVLVKSTGSLTHASNSAVSSARSNNREKDHLLDIRARVVTIEAGGMIHADGRGYGRMLGLGRGYTNSLGASHAGIGARNTGGTYGDFRAPNDLGSGGFNVDYGGLGGGLVRLEVSGTFRNDGVISANGEGGLTRSTAEDTGGGAGGSVNITADVLAGSGAIQALGGHNLNYGAGGGGRVAVIVREDQSTILPPASDLTQPSQLSTRGGANGTDSGGAGTIYLRRLGESRDSLIIDNADNNTALLTPIYLAASDIADAKSVLRDLVLVRRGNLQVRNALSLEPSGQILTRPGGPRSVLQIENGAIVTAPTSAASMSHLDLIINTGGTFVAPAPSTSMDTMYVYLGGTFGTTETLTLANTYFIHAGLFSARLGTLTVGAASTLERRGVTGIELDTLTVQSGGVITHGYNSGVSSVRSNNREKDHLLDIRAGTLTVEAGGAIHANGRGYGRMLGPGRGYTNLLGASHAGIGARNTGGTYGDFRSPFDLGSGGFNIDYGGLGGGIVRLEVSSTLRNDGNISANGEGGLVRNSVEDSGGGAGGSVNISTNILTGAGTVQALGGHNLNYGAGGGGRVAIVVRDDQSAILPPAADLTAPSQVSARGGANGTDSGGAGTIYLRRLGEFRDSLIIDNADNNTSLLTPIFLAAADVAEGTSLLRDVVLVRRGNLQVRNAISLEPSGQILTRPGAIRSVFQIENGATVTAPSSAASMSHLDLIVNAGGTFIAPAPATAMDTMYVYLGGTLGTTQRLELTNTTFVHAGTFSSRLGDLTVGASSTLERRGTGLIDLDTVTVRSGGVITHGYNSGISSARSNNREKDHLLDIRASAITVEAGGSIHADGRGYGRMLGPGRGYTNLLGASHAGIGARNTGGTYGDFRAPFDLGSGGFNIDYGGLGGGIVRLEVSGTLSNEGNISANGEGGLVRNSVEDSGGGAGGSVNISTNILAGAGTVQAIGGHNLNYGAGGGGRVAITVGDDQSAILPPVADLAAPSRISARGGANGTDSGGAGTIHLRRLGESRDSLIIDNADNNTALLTPIYIAAADLPSGTSTLRDLVLVRRGNLQVRNAISLEPSGQILTRSSGTRSVLQLESGAQVTAPSSSASMSHLDLIVNAGSTFVAPSPTTTMDTMYVYLGGTLETTQTLNLVNTTFIHAGTFSARLGTLDVGAASTFERRGVGLIELDAISVQSGGVLTHGANSAVSSARSNNREKDHVLDIRAQTITVEAGGAIHANGRGYGRMLGPGRGYTNSLGASHAGLGGRNPGGTYGDFRAPFDHGSGGFNVNYGGLGGGIVRLEVSGTLTNDGVISANGEGGLVRSSIEDPGGGSGGSVNITTAVLAGSGAVTALGGQNQNYGAGGGGRVAITYRDNISTIIPPTSEPPSSTQIATYGGSAAADSGGAGTVFVRDVDEPSGPNGRLIVDNLNHPVTLYTPLHLPVADVPAARTKLDEVTLKGRGAIQIPAGVTLEIPASAVIRTFATDAVSRPSVLISAGGRLLLPPEFAFSEVNLTNYGELAGGTDLRYLSGTWLNQPAVQKPFAGLTFGSGAVFEAAGTSTLEVSGPLVALAGSVLTHSPNIAAANTAPAVAHMLRFTANSVRIDAGAEVNVLAKGHSRAAGPGRGTSNSTSGGGGHGGAGGASSGAITGGPAHGDPSLPLTVGSGGGDDTNGAGDGGAGGGFVQVTACDTIEVNGNIIADGQLGRAGEGGGGAGGTVRLNTNVLAGSGTIVSRGGAGKGTTSGGGGGGGGRIALVHKSRTFSGTLSVAGGAKGGTGSAAAGGPGSFTEVINPAEACGDRPCGFGPCAGTVDPVTGACNYTATDGLSCSDGSLCTLADTCSAGLCVGGAQKRCDDGNQCSTDLCNPLGGCENTPRVGACDNGNACDEGDKCQNSVCVAGPKTLCDDGNACTTDSCAPATGCTFTNLESTPCDDGNPCTGGDLCGAGACDGERLEISGCYDAFPGPPVIGPAIADLLAKDGAVVTLDLTAYENDRESGPAADGNALTWSIVGHDPGLLEAEINPATDLLTLTPRSPDFAFSFDFDLYLTDGDGETDVETVSYTHEVSDYLLTLTAAPNPARPDGERVRLRATLESPTGRRISGRAIRFRMLEGDGILLSPNAITDASGVAMTTVLSGSAGVTHTFEAQFVTLADSLEAQTTVVVEPPARDASLSVLDLTFHDPGSGEEITPGDVNPLAANTPVELRANVHNSGREPSPALEVSFAHRLVTFDPPGLGDLRPIGTVTTEVIAPGDADPASLVASFRDEGFHMLTAIVDPNNRFVEGDENNNRASQGFWVGQFDFGGDPSEGAILTTCNLVSGSQAPSGVPGVAPSELMQLDGRADYKVLLPLDPDGSLGLAAVRGGLVSLSIYDPLEPEEVVEVTAGDKIVIPASGDVEPFTALRTLASAEAPADIGHFPNRTPDDIWDVTAPDRPGCFVLRACVSDGVAEGCCEQPFCVTPEGPKLECEPPATPLSGGLHTPPVVGDAIDIVLDVTNGGDYAAKDIAAQLIVDGVPVGVPATMTELDALESDQLSRSWVPTCGAREVAYELSWGSDFPGDTERRSTRCVTTMPDVSTETLDVFELDGGGACDREISLTKVITPGVDIPPGESIARFKVTPPSGPAVSLETDPALKTNNYAPFDFGAAGTYVVEAEVDGPFGLKEQCGDVPELDERTNNRIRAEFCADPSPGEAPTGATAEDLVVEPWPVIYGQPATVTVKVYNHGRLPVAAPIDVQLTSSRGPILDTGDVVAGRQTLEAHCGDPITDTPRELAWTWTPRYPTDGSPELRDLKVVVDPAHVYATCGEGVPNDQAIRTFDMNLAPSFSVDGPSKVGGTVRATLGMTHAGGIKPYANGGSNRIELVRDGGARSHTMDQVFDVVEDLQTLAWDVTADDCNVNLPLKYLRAEVDQNRTYLESNETDNEARWALPDLVPARLTRDTDGCNSTLKLTVEDRAEAPSVGSGQWDATIRIIAPDDTVQQLDLTGLEVGDDIEIDEPFESTLSGTYRYVVDIDTGPESACGGIIESNERNNRLEGSWTLCPDPAFVGLALSSDGPLQRGQPATIVATVKNAGSLAITRPFSVRLGTRTGDLVNLTEPVRTLAAECPIQVIGPGEEGTVEFELELDIADGLDAIAATIDPLDEMPEECSASNNKTVRPIWFDVSPWLNWQSQNYNQLRDITSEGFPQWNASVDIAHVVQTLQPPSGLRNSFNEPLASGFRVFPGVDEMEVAYAFVHRNGAKDVLDTAPLDALAADYPQDFARTIAFNDGYCDPANPIQKLEVFVDPTNAIREHLESNQRTVRNMPNLVVKKLGSSPVLSDRITLNYLVGNANFKEFYIGSWRGEASIKAPSGLVTTYDLGEQDGPYRTCQSCDPEGSAKEEIIFTNGDDGISVPENGVYELVVTVDVPDEANPCGAVPERDELDNRSEPTPLYLCPELSLSVLADIRPPVCCPNPDGEEEPPPPLDALPVNVTLRNIGQRDLAEDFTLRLRALDANGLPVPASFDPPDVRVTLDATPFPAGEDLPPFQFIWDSTAPGPAVDRIEAVVEVDDTRDNGRYPEDALCSPGKHGATRRASIPVKLPAPCGSSACDGEGDDGGGDGDGGPGGCLVTMMASQPAACQSNDFGFVVTGLESGAEIDAADLEPVALELRVIGPDGYPVSTDASFEPDPETPGGWLATLDEASSEVGTSVSAYVEFYSPDGSRCFAAADYLIGGGGGRLSVDDSNIEFVSLNEDIAPFDSASVGDMAEMRLTVSNKDEGCTATDVVGRAYIDLGFDRIMLGPWHIAAIAENTTASVVLRPNLSLPRPPALTEDESFLWRVTAPSPWIHIVTLEVERPDGEPLIATRPLYVGRFPVPGEVLPLSVTILSPEPGVLTRSDEEAFTFRVERNIEVDGEAVTEPVAPEELAALEVLATLDDGSLFEAPRDLLELEDAYLGDGEYATTFDFSDPSMGPTVTVDVRALLIEDDLSGIASGEYFFEEEPCEGEGPKPGDTGAACLVCLDEDGDGYLGLTDECPGGADCDDADPDSTTLDDDGDCDGVPTYVDCDDTDPTLAEDCDLGCFLEEPRFDASVSDLTVVAEDCATDDRTIGWTLRNDGTAPLEDTLQVALYIEDPTLAVAPTLTFTIGEAELVDGELPLEPSAAATFRFILPADLVPDPDAELYLIVNHGPDTVFVEDDLGLHTRGAAPECELSNNAIGPVLCESSATESECSEDADCGLAEDLCDSRICVDGLCEDADSGTDWAPCEDDPIVYVRISRGAEVGFIPCRLETNEDDNEVVNCEADEYGQLVVYPAPPDMFCAPKEDGR